jgi:dTDP-4-dehydrorhamnose reductase
VDLAQPGSSQELVEAVQPELIVHCAAIAVIDLAEANPQLTWRVNAEVPGELAAAARRVGSKMIHISTDAVFDGQRGDYAEQDETNPLNVYARSKLGGEQAVAQANPDAIIARVNFYGWSLTGQRSLGELFINHLQAGKPMFGFTDVFFCTLQVNVLTELLLSMAQRNLCGLYHVVSRESLSKYDFGCRLARKFGLDENLIQPTSWKDGGLKAARSPNLTLRTDKLSAALGEPLPDQAVGMERFYRMYVEGYREKLRQLAD